MKHYKILRNEISWIFVLVFGCAVFFLQFLLINGIGIISTVFFLLNIIVIAVLKRKVKDKPAIEIDKSLLRQCLVVFLIIPMLLSIVFFVPDTQSNGEVQRHSPVLTMYVYTNHYIDHTNHIHMSRYISLNNKVPYFAEADGELISDFLHYPQLIHSVHASIYDGARMANAVVGEPVSNLSLLYISYHFIFFVLLSMSAAVLWYFAHKHVYPKLKYFNKKVFTLLSITAIAAIVVFPYMSMALYGFLTQAAAELLLLLSAIVLIERTKSSFVSSVLIPLCFLNILMGHVWWVISVPLLAVTAIIFLVSASSEKFSKLISAFLKCLLYGVTTMIAVIPALAMVFINNKSLRTQTILDGPYEPISFRLMFIIYGLGLIFVLVLLKKSYDKQLSFLDNIKNALRSWLILPAAVIGFVVAYICYQLLEINVVNYYGNKLMWTSISLTVLALIYCLSHLVGEHSKIWKWTNSKLVVVVLVTLAVIASVGSTLYIVREQQQILAGVLPQEKRLAGLIKFLEQNKSESDYVINSQYNFTEDYIAQRFAYIIRPTYENVHLQFMNLNNLGNTPARDETFKELVEKDKASSVVSLRGCFPVANVVHDIDDEISVFEITANGNVEVCKRD